MVFPDFFLIFYMGKIGNYDLWLLRKHDKQLW